MELSQVGGHFVARFSAMASPCEVLVETTDSSLAAHVGELVEQEAVRIERKYSRYRNDSVISQVNRSAGRPVAVDEETGRLLDYSAQCFLLSNGRFDVTAGVLRRAWKFDGSDRVPTSASVETLLPLIGWKKVQWQYPHVVLPHGMEIDFGGIGKEYAVDSACKLVMQQTDVSTVINFGGDLFVTGPRKDGSPWQIGVDDPYADGKKVVDLLSVRRGGVATSGDARRFLCKNGVRYGHILNPETGWPVANAPRSVTVIANTCTDAGMLATFSMLEGVAAEDFLRAQNLVYRCVW